MVKSGEHNGIKIMEDVRTPWSHQSFPPGPDQLTRHVADTVKDRVLLIDVNHARVGLVHAVLTGKGDQVTTFGDVQGGRWEAERPLDLRFENIREVDDVQKFSTWKKTMVTFLW